MRFLAVALIPFILVSCLGKNKMQASVIEQADKLGTYLKRKEYDRYISKMAFFVYANKREKKQLKEELKRINDFNEERDLTFVKVSSFMNSDIYENGGYYQCIVKQVRYYTNNFTTITSNAYLLAISKEGEEWTFADITGVGDRTLRAVFKEMHPDLTLKRAEEDKLNP